MCIFKSGDMVQDSKAIWHDQGRLEKKDEQLEHIENPLGHQRSAPIHTTVYPNPRMSNPVHRTAYIDETLTRIEAGQRAHHHVIPSQGP
eukprot:5573333-Amphidinium_carterae.4